MAEKIRILFLAANPIDARVHLRLDEEARAIRKQLQAGSNRESFEVVSEWAVRPSHLQEALLMHNPHIVHFSGHPNNNKGITLEGRDGKMKPVSKQALAELFRILKGNIRIVFLNACYSRRQIGGLRKVIDFTIAMNSTIGAETAVVFASHFYQGLAFGRSVIEAFELAKLQLELVGINESKTPELFVRQGVDVSRAYLIKTAGGDRAHEGGAERSSSKFTVNQETEAEIGSVIGIHIHPLEDSRSFRTVKGPAKRGSVSSAVVARAVRKVANRRA
jgi:hypothetical protein